MLILFFILIIVCLSHSKISVKDAGVATISRGDIGMIFYITLENLDHCTYSINVKMLKCCEYNCGTDMDCKMMTLIGGDMGTICPKSTKNVSLLYPNMYLHSRKGNCLLAITSTKGHNIYDEITQKITFDTTLSRTNIPPILRDYYNKHDVLQCDTTDLDPFDNCEPVNCHMKYLGCRNYYNPKWKRCQKVPLCIADSEKELPDVGYFPISNKCRDLEKAVTENDLHYLEKGLIEGSWDSKPAPMLAINLRCHHGVLDNDTGYCICNFGWTSAPFDKDQYEPGLSVYHMCNIQITNWNGINRNKIMATVVIIALFGVVIALLVILTSFLLNILYKCLQSYESPTPFARSNSDSNNTRSCVINADCFKSCTSNRRNKYSDKSNTSYTSRDRSQQKSSKQSSDKRSFDSTHQSSSTIKRSVGSTHQTASADSLK